MLTATRKAWMSRDGDSLVPDGHVLGAALFCRAGGQVTEQAASVFGNAREFFVGWKDPLPTDGKADLGQKVEAEEPEEDSAGEEDSTGEAEEDIDVFGDKAAAAAEAPKKGRGRPKKGH